MLILQRGATSFPAASAAGWLLLVAGGCASHGRAADQAIGTLVDPDNSAIVQISITGLAGDSPHISITETTPKALLICRNYSLPNNMQLSFQHSGQSIWLAPAPTDTDDSGFDPPAPKDWILLRGPGDEAGWDLPNQTFDGIGAGDVVRIEWQQHASPPRDLIRLGGVFATSKVTADLRVQ